MDGFLSRKSSLLRLIAAIQNRPGDTTSRELALNAEAIESMRIATIFLQMLPAGQNFEAACYYRVESELDTANSSVSDSLAAQWMLSFA